ncbi:MAG: D-alanyl-D-alanine carboxypeptidase [Butyrivibrio sp.]|nr:D-alanyl-D-alanine carboxypeptidase [Acetatifactor muris]MCM1560479.1 D-alanyl-D-alanine carboxypeptidase [Butyrivibrio sp.]
MRMKIMWGFFCAVFLAVRLSAGAVWETVLPEAGILQYADGSALSPEADTALYATEEELHPAADTALYATEEELHPEADISLYATAAVLMDGDTGRVLYGKSENTPMAMASTTKILTCILVLENVSPDEVLEVSAYASGMPKVKLYLKQGEQYTVKDLLYSLMLESHNDSAVALAEHVGKRLLDPALSEKPSGEYTAEESGKAVAAFARLMNEKAVELGCRDSWFITPNGLDATQEFILQDGTVIQKEHCTTAAELARIMSYCVGESPQRDAFLEITGTLNYSFYANGRSFSCTNHNAFLNMMSGALSGKTGFTNKAGYCYVGALERDGRTFVVALLACGWPNHKTWKWSDTKELMEYGLENYFYRSFEEAGTAFDESLLKPVPVENGQTDRLGTPAYTNLAILESENPESEEADCPNVDGLLLREDEEIRTEYEWEKTLAAPVERGTQVGEIRYVVGETVYRREKIVTADAVPEIGFDWCVKQILNRFLGL